MLTPNLCFSCRTPTAAAVTLTHFDPSASGVGLWVNRKERVKKIQTAIWNLNETKSISLCCHFIFHCFDSDGTGGLQGAFCFARRVLSSGGLGEGGEKKWLTDRRSPWPHHRCRCPWHSRSRRGGRLSLETEKELQKQEANEGPLTRLNTSSDQNWAGREAPPPLPGKLPCMFSNTNRAGLGAS